MPAAPPSESAPEWARPVAEYTRYDVGVTEHHPGPETKEIRHVLYLVAYDICEPKRLRKVAEACDAFGVRIEKSVFECDLPPEQFDRLWCRLIDLIKEDEDAVVAYRICASCHRQIESIGVVPRPEKPLCYIL